MYQLYVEVDSNNAIVNISTVSQGSTYIPAMLEDDRLDFNKLPGYYLENLGAYNRLTFNENKYNQIKEEQKRQEDIKTGELMFSELRDKAILDSADDSQAYVMRYKYDKWETNTAYQVGDRRLYGDNLYKCKQAQTSQNDWTPDKVPALWDLIAPEDDPTLGTKDNPIIIPEPFSSMVYICGKYYKEDDTLYLMKRDGMEDGEEITLYYKPSALVGHYFEVVQIVE